MNYLITGGTGFIGKAFISSLNSEQDSITILSRKDINSTEKCRYIKSLSEIENSEEYDCIINLAGKPVDCLWTKANKKELISSRIDTTKEIIKLTERLTTKPKSIISASAIGYYGNSKFNSDIDESSKGIESFTNRLCLMWEQEALKAEKLNIRVCLIRLGVVLGKNGGFIKKTYIPYKLGLGGKMAKGDQLFPWIHIDDVISSIKFLIDNTECFGPYNLTSPSTISNEELNHSIGKALNRPTIFTVPKIFIETIFGEMGKELLLHGLNVKPKKLLDTGFKFKFENINQALSNIYSGKQE